jgi:hypothetical protein
MCKKSESITNLAVSLTKFNLTVQRIEKDRENGHFKNRYTTLDAILDEVRPLLADQGLSIIQMPSGEGDQLKLTTMLVHISGEWIESDAITMRPTKNDPQGIGSATTYARRYSLCAFLGLSTGEVDDDGNAASQTPRTSQNASQSQGYNSPPPQSQPSATQSSASSEAITSGQIGLIKKLVADKKIPDNMYRVALGTYGVTSSTEMNKRDASALIKRLTDYVQETVPPDDNIPF